MNDRIASRQRGARLAEFMAYDQVCMDRQGARAPLLKARHDILALSRLW